MNAGRLSTSSIETAGKRALSRYAVGDSLWGSYQHPYVYLRADVIDSLGIGPVQVQRDVADEIATLPGVPRSAGGLGLSDTDRGAARRIERTRVHVSGCERDRDRRGHARPPDRGRGLGIVTRILYANINPPVALTTRGKTVVKGGAAVDGNDTYPSSWSSYRSTSDDKPGVLTNDTSAISAKGGGTITGNPA